MECPFCKEDIQDGAIKCKHCGSMLTGGETTISTPPKTKLCPFCKEEVKGDAIKCRHCKSMLTGPSSPSQTGVTVARTSSNLKYTDYSQIPWYRRRWFALLSAIFLCPVFILLLWTRGFYFMSKGQLKEVPGPGPWRLPLKILFTVGSFLFFKDFIEGFIHGVG